MDNRPLGIFDSGVGGLTIAKQIYKTLPSESTIYLGDTARFPYGNRSRDTIIRFSRQITAFLLKQDVKAIVIACSTASAQALETLQAELPVPVFGVIQPAAEMAAAATKTGAIAVIGTAGTINNQAFPKAISTVNPHLTVASKACPLLVSFVEEGILSGTLLASTVHYYLDGFVVPPIDTVIMGCTHYPVITATLGEAVGPDIMLINPGKAIAATLKTELARRHLESDHASRTTHQYYTTDNPQNFLNIARIFLGKSLRNHTTQIIFD